MITSRVIVVVLIVSWTICFVVPLYQCHSFVTNPTRRCSRSSRSSRSSWNTRSVSSSTTCIKPCFLVPVGFNVPSGCNRKTSSETRRSTTATAAATAATAAAAAATTTTTTTTRNLWKECGPDSIFELDTDGDVVDKEVEEEEEEEENDDEIISMNDHNRNNKVCNIPNNNKVNTNDQHHADHRYNPTPALLSFWKDRKSTRPSTAMVVVMTFVFTVLVWFSSPFPSLAAMSGGRMGGSFSSPSTTSRTYSSGSSYSSSLSSPSPSPSSFSRGYSKGFQSGYGTGYTAGGVRRPRVIVTTPYYYGSTPWVNPYTAPTIRPYYNRYSTTPGIITYHRGPNVFDLIVLGAIFFAISSVVFNNNNSLGAVGTSTTVGSSFWDDHTTTTSTTTNRSWSVLGPGTSVIKISVALDVPNRNSSDSILRILHRLSETATTDSRIGIQHLSSQVALELLRKRSSIIAACTQYQHYTNRQQAQRKFNSISIRERAKFQKETISQFGGVDYSTSATTTTTTTSADTVIADPNDHSFQATMAVVTLILSIDGDSTKIPSTIRSIKDIEQALEQIAADTKVDDCLQSAEILWTPEDPKETLSYRDVIADYPDLRTI